LCSESARDAHFFNFGRRFQDDAHREIR
jgi:hypothetical protein